MQYVSEESGENEDFRVRMGKHQGSGFEIYFPEKWMTFVYSLLLFFVFFVL